MIKMRFKGQRSLQVATQNGKSEGLQIDPLSLSQLPGFKQRSFQPNLAFWSNGLLPVGSVAAATSRTVELGRAFHLTTATRSPRKVAELVFTYNESTQRRSQHNRCEEANPRLCSLNAATVEPLFLQPWPKSREELLGFPNNS